MDFIIPNAEINSSHTVTLYAVDEFSTKSNEINFTYVIVDIYQPEIRLTKGVQHAFANFYPIFIEGEFRDPDKHERVCINSRNDGINFTQHRCFDNIDDYWHAFSFKYDTRQLSIDVHELSLFSFTTLESTPIVIKYAILDRYSEICINFVTNNCMGSFIRVAMFFSIVIIDMDTILR